MKRRREEDQAPDVILVKRTRLEDTFEDLVIDEATVSRRNLRDADQVMVFRRVSVMDTPVLDRTATYMEGVGQRRRDLGTRLRRVRAGDVRQDSTDVYYTRDMLANASQLLQKGIGITPMDEELWGDFQSTSEEDLEFDSNKEDNDFNDYPDEPDDDNESYCDYDQSWEYDAEAIESYGFDD